MKPVASCTFLEKKSNSQPGWSCTFLETSATRIETSYYLHIFFEKVKLVFKPVTSFTFLEKNCMKNR